VTRTLAQVDARTTAEITNRSKADAKLEARIASLEEWRKSLDESGDPDPIPDPPPTTGQRRFPAGTYSQTYRLDANEEWIFEPGAVLTGVLRWAAPSAVVRNLTARDGHETQLIFEKGGGGQLLEPTILHTGTPANGKGYSSIGADDKNAGVGTFGPLLIKGGTIDQRIYGWGGIEMWGVKQLVIDDVMFLGRAGVGANINAHISIPRSDGAIVKGCTFDLSGVTWGLELSDVDNVQVLDNTGEAIGQQNLSQMWRAFVQLHPGSGNVNGTTILRNHLTNFPALVNVPPPGKSTAGVTTVRDNVLSGVPRLSWGTNPWPGVTNIGNNAGVPG
jgi:hypothetical protein